MDLNDELYVWHGCKLLIGILKLRGHMRKKHVHVLKIICFSFAMEK